MPRFFAQKHQRQWAWKQPAYDTANDSKWVKVGSNSSSRDKEAWAGAVDAQSSADSTEEAPTLASWNPSGSASDAATEGGDLRDCRADSSDYFCRADSAELFQEDSAQATADHPGPDPDAVIEKRLCSSANLFIPRRTQAQQMVQRTIAFLWELLQGMCANIAPKLGNAEKAVTVSLHDPNWWAESYESWLAAQETTMQEVIHTCLRGLCNMGDIFDIQPAHDASRIIVRYLSSGTEDVCWEFVRKGCCPRGASCRWKHLQAMQLSIDFSFADAGSRPAPAILPAPLLSAPALPVPADAAGWQHPQAASVQPPLQQQQQQLQMWYQPQQQQQLSCGPSVQPTSDEVSYSYAGPVLCSTPPTGDDKGQDIDSMHAMADAGSTTPSSSVQEPATPSHDGMLWRDSSLRWADMEDEW